MGHINRKTLRRWISRKRGHGGGAGAQQNLEDLERERTQTDLELPDPQTLLLDAKREEEPMSGDTSNNSSVRVKNIDTDKIGKTNRF